MGRTAQPDDDYQGSEQQPEHERVTDGRDVRLADRVVIQGKDRRPRTTASASTLNRHVTAAQTSPRAPVAARQPRPIGTGFA
jgi:hypothetical protein